MRSFLKYFFFLILPVAVVILWLAGFFHPKLSAREVQTETKIIKNLKVGRVLTINKVSLSFVGTVVASEKAEISTRTMGYVSYISVKEGDYVRKGELLLKIDPRDTKAQVESARQKLLQAKESYKVALTNYKTVEKTYKRYLKLLQEKAVTQHEFDMVEAKYRIAKSQLEMAKSAVKVAEENLKAVSTNLSYAEVRAPFSGYVVSKKVDVGDMARPGSPLIVMEKPPFKVEVNLPARMLRRMRLGDEFYVLIETLGRKFRARVVEIEPAVDPTSRTFRVKAILEGKGLRSGYYAKVFVEESAERTLLIPKRAVYKRWDFTGVWVVKPDNTLELRFVRLGKSFGDLVEVLSGLSEGERIVVDGLERACDGCRVGG